MNTVAKILVPVLASSLILIPVLDGHAAESPCKGLAEVECTAKEVIPGSKACIWVKGYKTVAGTDRKSYCRASNKKAPEQTTEAKN